MPLVGIRRAATYLARRHTRWWREFFIDRNPFLLERTAGVRGAYTVYRRDQVYDDVLDRLSAISG